MSAPFFLLLTACGNDGAAAADASGDSSGAQTEGSTTGNASTTTEPVASTSDASTTDPSGSTSGSTSGESGGDETSPPTPGVAPGLEFALGDQRLRVGDSVANPAAPTGPIDEGYAITYASSDPLVVTVDALGELTTVGSGFATVTATLTLDSGDTSTETYATMVSFVAEAWVGPTDTALVFDEGATGVEMFRSSAPGCDIENVAACPDGQSDVLVAHEMIVDTAMTTDRPGYYSYVYGGVQHDLPMSIARAPSVRDHRGVVWHDKIWIVGGNGVGLGSAVTSTADGQNWITETEDGGFPPRSFHAQAVHDDRLWLANGDSPLGDPYGDVWVSDDGVTWDPMPAPPWTARHGGRLVSFGGRLLMMGGFDTEHRSDIWSSEDGETWTLETEAAPWPAASRFSVVEFEDQLVWVGPSATQTEVWVSDDGVAWTQATDAAEFGRRIGPGVAAFEGRLWAVGGYQEGFQADVWSSGDGATWVLENDAPGFAPRELASVLSFDQRLWVVLGSSTTNLRDAWSSLDGTSWAVESNGAAFEGRWGHSTISWNDRIWLFGGWGNDLEPIEDAWSSADGIAWVQESPSGLPTTLAPVEVFDDALWLVGGHVDGATTSAVHRSDDGLAWTPQGDAPFPARMLHATAVFDDRLWVIGGASGTGDEYGDVWTWDGASWTEESAPPFGPLSSHQAVVYANALWVIHRGEVWRHADGTWTQPTDAAAFGPRTATAVAANANGMYVIAGFTATLHDDVWHSTDGISWAPATDTAGFAGRLYTSALQHDGHLFVIGGVLDPFFQDNANDVWRSVDDGQSWRRGHRAALTF